MDKINDKEEINKKHILIVDEDIFFLETLRKFLNSKFKNYFKVLGAQSGEEAISILNSFDKKIVGQKELAIILSNYVFSTKMQGNILMEYTNIYFPLATKVFLTDLRIGYYDKFNDIIELFNLKILDAYLRRNEIEKLSNILPYIEYFKEIYLKKEAEALLKNHIKHFENFFENYFIGEPTQTIGSIQDLSYYKKINTNRQYFEKIRKEVEPKKYILIVDDEKVYLDPLKEFLRSNFSDYFIFCDAQSGEEAIELMEALMKRNREVALVISDYRFPTQMKGDELLNLTKEIYPLAVKVMLVGGSFPNNITELFNFKIIDGYLHKIEDDLTICIEHFIEMYFINIDKELLKKKLNHYENFVENYFI